MARENIVHLIRQRSSPDDLAVVEMATGRHRSFGELLDASASLALPLTAALGERGGDRVFRVGVFYPSGSDYIALALAVLEAGACFVPIPDELALAEKQELCERTGLDAVLCAPGVVEGWLPEGSPETIASGDLTVSLWRCARRDKGFPEATFAALNPAFIRFSSGTTGRSKGVVLSHASLRDRIVAANAGLEIGAADRVLWVLPMAHHFAVSIILYLYHGATTILADGSMGGDLLNAASSQKATVMYGSPFHFRQLAGAPNAKAWSTLRLAVSTAAALNEDTAKAFHSRFGLPLVQGLGIIEVGLPFLNRDAALSESESIGQLLPGYRAMVRPLESGDAESVGELCLQGPGLFDAYVDPWQPRSEVLNAEGWFATGDLVDRDASGNWFLCGRLKSVINVGGMKVFAEEVERVLEACPGVHQALVTSQANTVFGEVPVASYLPSGNPVPPSALKAHCRERLSAFKIPLSFEAVESLPRTASGKLRRVSLSSPLQSA